MIGELKHSKYKDEMLLQGLKTDLKEAVLNVQPRRYQDYGHSMMTQQIRGHYEQRSNPFMG